jgi:hypothetical protein
MLSSTAIVSLACLLSTGEVDSAKVVEGLSQQELILVQQVANSGACEALPESFRRLINNQVSGMPGPSPTSDFRVAGPHGSPTSDFASLSPTPTSDY